MPSAFDVVVVPDFVRRAPMFEVRTLFFLASWLTNGGEARNFPLHLACIGDPPPSVRWLAAKSNASITIHEPVGANRRGTANKLRGLEIERREKSLLLLDADILVLADISGLAEIDDCIAAAPATFPRVPARDWQKIYVALGMQPPTERIASLRGELLCTTPESINYKEQLSEFSAMFPYYNSGVLLAPWHCGLRSLWEDHIHRIAALFDEDHEVWGAVGNSDQAGLATSIEFLKRQGVRFVRLPQTFHGQFLHLYRRTLSLRDMKLFHAIGLGRRATSRPEAIRQTPALYCTWLVERMQSEWQREQASRSQVGDADRYPPPPLTEVDALGDVLQDLYRHHVAPALRQYRPICRYYRKLVHQFRPKTRRPPNRVREGH